MKKLTSTLLLPVLLCLCMGCAGTKLETGGAYAPPGQEPDLAFYIADGAFDIAYATFDTVFKFERANREVLWKLSPEIKRDLDKIRPEAWDVVTKYSKAREVYRSHPTPEGLSDLERILADAQRIAATAQATLPK